MSDPRIRLWENYLAALFDAIGPNRNRLTLLQRMVFIVWPWSWWALIKVHRAAEARDLIEPFGQLFASPLNAVGIGLAWLLASVWVFRERIRAHKWSGELGAKPVYLVLFLLTLAVGAVWSYVVLRGY
jgi:hypothetical protein